VLLTVLDASALLDEQDHAVLQAAAGIPQVIVLNKIDLPRCISEEDLTDVASEQPVVAVSARERLGLSALRRAVVTRVGAGTTIEQGAPMLTNIRHRDALEKARESLVMARDSVTAARPADLLAVDVQDAIDYLAEITGAITSEEVLDRIFSQFCIGK
jgi:tRNA modification GTPase